MSTTIRPVGTFDSVDTTATVLRRDLHGEVRWISPDQHVTREIYVGLRRLRACVPVASLASDCD